MKRCILAFDSFKGTMSAMEVCDIVEATVKSNYPCCEVIKMPIADGGEGTVECVLSGSAEGYLREVPTVGPFGEDIKAPYAVVNGDTAVIEMAKAAGLELARGRFDPMLASTFGVGKIISDAVDAGFKKIIVGLGGSCTNDAGTGAACALGAEFFDKNGDRFIPTGGTLKDIRMFSIDKARRKLSDVKISCMCDIDNPMYGENGAAYVFAPQKGADEKTVRELDAGLKHLNDLIIKEMGIDCQKIRGAGAAGAMGAGMKVFLKSALIRGIDLMLQIMRFDDLVSGCDLVLTGEGRTDFQSAGGKAVSGVVKAARDHKVDVVVISGSVGEGFENVLKLGAKKVICATDKESPIEVIRETCREDLYNAADRFFKSAKIR